MIGMLWVSNIPLEKFNLYIVKLRTQGHIQNNNYSVKELLVYINSN